MLISVIICTYNREKDLTEMLKSLLELELDDTFRYEVIIVDNNSTDGTRNLIYDYKMKNKFIKYVFEPKQGLSYARNAGVRESLGSILAFTDDDVLLDSGWLKNISKFFLKNDFDAIGGRVEAVFNTNASAWVKKNIEILCGPIIFHNHGDQIISYKHEMNPFIGANMIIKKEVFSKVGLFNADIGPGKGTMGEDTEFYFRMQNLNLKIIYNPEILVLHPVAKERMSFVYFAKWHIAFGKYLVLSKKKKRDEFICYFGVPRYLFRECLNYFFLLFLPVGFKSFYKSWKNLFIRIGMIQCFFSKNSSPLKI